MPVVLTAADMAAQPGAHVTHPYWCAGWPWCGVADGVLTHQGRPVQTAGGVLLVPAQTEGYPATVTFCAGRQPEFTLPAEVARWVGLSVSHVARALTRQGDPR